MISVSEALKIIERETFAPAAETVELEKSVGRVLAETVKADMDLPPFDRSQMDGFAVRAKDVKNAPVLLDIIGESVAGKGFDGAVYAGQAVRIMTGARVPDGADAVQKVELTVEKDGFIEILETVRKQQNISLRGQEIEKGAKVFKKGEIITRQKIASLAAFGYAKIKVYRRPKVSIFSTGSEIVNIAETPRQDQIRNSNSLMLKTFADVYADARILPIINDDLENLKNKIAEAVGIESKVQSPKSKIEIANSKFRISTPKFEGRKVAEKSADETAAENFDKMTAHDSEIWNLKSDILIITGGVSVGDYDFTKPALRELGAEIFFEQISLKPGKPTVFAKLNDVLIFGLPGNPVSVAATFYLFVRTAILRMQSAKSPELKKGFAVVTDKIKGVRGTRFVSAGFTLN